MNAEIERLEAEIVELNTRLGDARPRAVAEPVEDGALRRLDGSIVRTGRASFGPGDPFCAAWHLFDLLAGGAKGWSPKFSYPS